MDLHRSPIEFFIRTYVGQTTAFLALLSVVFLVVWRWGAARFRGRRIHTRRHADAAQIRGEVANSLVALAAGAMNATLVAALHARGLTRLSTDPAGWSAPSILASAVGLILLNDLWFYGCHRLLHRPWLFARVHAVHHRSVDVNPFTSYSFHAVEAVMVGAWAAPLVMLVPLYAPVFGLVQVVGTANNVMSHLGYEFMPRWLLRVPGLRWINTATFHSLHHTAFHGNYGLFTRLWDRLFGTELPGYERAFLGRGKALGRVSAGRARVVAVRAESPSTVSLTVDRDDLHGEPGQFLQVRFRDAWRSYSLSHPDAVRLTVKRVPGGAVSSALCDAAAVGMELDVRGPYGAFGATLPVRGRVLFIAGGSGVTPFGAMVPEAVRRGLATRVIVANRAPADAPLLDELRAVPGAEVIAHFDAAAGQLDASRLGELLGARPDGVWGCGPAPLIDLARRVVAARWPDVPFVEERFVRASSELDAPRRLTVVVDGARHPLQVDAGRSILDAARGAGVAMPSGCEQGACGACRVRVLRGAVETPEAACLRDDERREGFALACVGRPDEGAEITPSPR